MLIGGVTNLLGIEPGRPSQCVYAAVSSVLRLAAAVGLVILSARFFGFPCATFARSAVFPKDGLTRTTGSVSACVCQLF
jgi:hypothetical protein